MNDMEQAKARFEELRKSVYHQFVVKLRRFRAAQLRELLSKPEQVTLELFNSDVWGLENKTILKGQEEKDITGEIFGDEPWTLLSNERVGQLEKALESSQLELHGNYVWGSGSAQYLPGTKDSSIKENNIREALKILNQPSLVPMDKAMKMQEINGFGPNISTGLVMLFHPLDFTIFNGPSHTAVATLGYKADKLDDFEESAADLRAAFDAHDFFELDWFFYLFAHLLQKRYFQIAPGEGARLWQEFFTSKIAAVGWDDLNLDLTGKRKKELIDLYLANRPEATLPEAKLNASMLSSFVNLKPGDKIISNKGKTKLLAVGEVTGYYQFQPNRKEYRHTAPVEYVKVNEKGIDIPEEMQGIFGKTIVPLAEDKFMTLEKLFPDDVKPPSDTYTLSQMAADTSYDVTEISFWVEALKRKRHAIFYGPPGTGKTFVAQKMAKHLSSKGESKGIVDIVQFHPAYAYEDFIQGLRPVTTQDGNISYSLIPGRFLDFCKKAANQGPSVLIIDEINRANLARVFGELMYLLEYRGEGIPLAAGDSFSIPDNVYLIGTMNTADRSIALVDHALRRRFAFISLYPNYSVLSKYHSSTGFDPSGLIGTLKALNNRIGDKHYEIGISFFLHNDIKANIESVWRMEIEPYLDEYFFDRQEVAEEFRWEKIKGKVLGE